MRLFPFGLGIAALTFVLDQLSKYLVRGLLVPDSWNTVYVLPVFNINHAWNYGVSFSLFTSLEEARRWALIAVALALCALVGWWLKSASTRLQAFAYGLVLGGALGNVCDRVIYGAVFDFLQFHLAGYYWPSFNLADSAICVGVALLLWAGRPEGWFGQKQDAESK